MSDERATAFVPGHVTAFFSTHPADDPAAAGSRGAGLTLTDGVEVTVERVADPDAATVAVAGEASTVAPVETVLDRLGARVSVDIDPDLPVGAGFGVSGAAALGTALAANAVLDAGYSENELITMAHEAEVEAGTGLGDVVAQARGGVPIRLEPGAPGYGSLDGIPASGRIEYVTFGELSTEEVLAGDTGGLSAAGERALTTLRRDPRLPTLMAAAHEFAHDAGLVVPEVAEALAAVEEAGGVASMAMLGRTVFALDDGLSAAGYDAEACRIHAAGARLADGD